MRIAAELHCHTYHSDGRFSPAELAQSALDAQIDIIALTDHNTMSGYGELEKTGIPFIRGIEWTTFFGHMLVLGQKRVVDWRDATVENIDDKIAEVHDAGGLVGIAHPFQIGHPFCTGCYWDFAVKKWDTVDYMEVWHLGGIPSLRPHNRRARKMWMGLLDAGYRITPVFGPDWHRPSAAPDPLAVTYLEADDLSGTSAVNAIKDGRTLLSLGPDLIWDLTREGNTYTAGDSIPAGACRFNAKPDFCRRREAWEEFGIRIDRILLYGAGEKILAELPGEGGSVDCTLTPADRYARVEALGTAEGKECTVCLSAPVYIE